MPSTAMELKQLSPEEYAAAFDSGAPHVYNTAAFACHNAALADELMFFALASGRKLRLGLIAGRRGDCWCSPFSAPFGGMTAKGEQSIESYRAFTALIADRHSGVEGGLRVTLPPAFYAPDHIAKQTVALAERGTLLYADINHHRPLHAATPPRSRFFPRTIGTLRLAETHSAEWETFGTERPDAVDRAYAIIAANHADLGYPVRMSLRQVMATAPLTGSRFTILRLDGKDAAAAMVNSSAPGVAQVIYWGDLLSARSLHPMSKLADIVMTDCAAAGFTELDIGPSSSEGIPSAGLSRFKESLGCITSVKPTFVLK